MAAPGKYLPVAYRKPVVTKEEIVKDLQAVAIKNNKNTVTWNEYEKQGQYSPDTVRKKFGSWNEALNQSQLIVTKYRDATKEDYLKNIKKVWDALDRQPKYTEMKKPLSKFSISAYEKKFGNWTKALKEFYNYISTGQVNGLNVQSSYSKRRKGGRTIPDGLRYKVFKRDGFKCVICGRSPSSTHGVELEADHKIPWAKGGRQNWITSGRYAMIVTKVEVVQKMNEVRLLIRKTERNQQ